MLFTFLVWCQVHPEAEGERGAGKNPMAACASGEHPMSLRKTSSSAAKHFPCSAVFFRSVAPCTQCPNTLIYAVLTG